MRSTALSLMPRKLYRIRGCPAPGMSQLPIGLCKPVHEQQDVGLHTPVILTCYSVKLRVQPPAVASKLPAKP